MLAFAAVGAKSDISAAEKTVDRGVAALVDDLRYHRIADKTDICRVRVDRSNLKCNIKYSPSAGGKRANPVPCR